MKFISLLTTFLILVAKPAIASSLTEASKFTVRVKSSIQYAFAEDEAGTIWGAGFLVDAEKGWIATNAHVSGRGNARIEISFKSQQYEPAEAVYVDPHNDLAIIKIDPSLLPEATPAAGLQCSEIELNGREVAAFGHPHGLAFSASRGIISQVRTLDGLDWVQTDAAINVGNSGGPLIDLETGLVVGVNSMGYKNTQGLNFAVPTAPLCSILALLKKDKDPSPPDLPLLFATDEELDEHLIVARVLDEAWGEAFYPGDIVTHVNNTDVYTPNELNEALRGFSGLANLGVLRDGFEIDVQVPIKAAGSLLERPYMIMDGALISYDVYPERRSTEALLQFHSIAAGSLAEQSELKPYHLIWSVNGVTPRSLEELKELLMTEDEASIIIRYWSESEGRLNDYLHVKYSPENVEIKFP